VRWEPEFECGVKDRDCGGSRRQAWFYMATDGRSGDTTVGFLPFTGTRSSEDH